MPNETSPLLHRCLSLDLEVGVRDRRIRAFAGVRAHTGESLVFPSAREGLVPSQHRYKNWYTLVRMLGNGVYQ